MKRKMFIISLCFIIVFNICGCETSSTETLSSNCVDLCDYKSLEVPLSEYSVSDEDLNAAIQIRLSYLDIDANEISDDIANKYFSSENAIAAIGKIKREIVENRFYEAASVMILEMSGIVKYPEGSDEYVDRMISMQKRCADCENISLSEYLYRYYEMSEKEYCEAILGGYAEYLILSAIAYQEGYVISEREREERIQTTANEINLSAEKTIELYGMEFFDVLLYEEFLKSLIISNYSSEIALASML